MTLGELSVGDYFCFTRDQRPTDEIDRSGALMKRTGPGKNEFGDIDCRCVMAFDDIASHSGWYPHRRVVRVFPCKCCLDRVTGGAPTRCPCWFKEKDS